MAIPGLKMADYFEGQLHVQASCFTPFFAYCHINKAVFLYISGTKKVLWTQSHVPMLQLLYHKPTMLQVGVASGSQEYLPYGNSLRQLKAISVWPARIRAFTARY